jgi:hypothetical protein
MAKKTEAQKEKARQYSRDWYARQQREKREAAADAKSADPIKAAAKRLSKWADEELSIRLSPKHENKAAKAATALTVAGRGHQSPARLADPVFMVRLLVAAENTVSVHCFSHFLLNKSRAGLADYKPHKCPRNARAWRRLRPTGPTEGTPHALRQNAYRRTGSSVPSLG